MIEYINRLSQALRSIDQKQIDRVVSMIKKSHRSNGSIWIFGNGGSFANALHWSCDFSKVAMIRCSALGSNGASLTAFSNDIGYSDAVMLEFRRVARYGDLLIVLSCSGYSLNVTRLLSESRRINVDSVLFTGSLNDLPKYATEIIKVDSGEYEIIEDCHASIGHIITKRLSDENDNQSRAVRLRIPWGRKTETVK